MFIVSPEIEARYGKMIAKLVDVILPAWVLDHIDVEILAMQPGQAEFRLHSHPQLFRRFPPPVEQGHLAGQVVMALADTLLVFPVIAEIGDDREMATLNLSTEFLRPIHDGDIRIVAQVLKIGRTAIRGRVDIHDEAGRLCATSTVCYVFVNPANHHTTGDA